MTHAAADGTMIENIVQFDLQQKIADAEGKKPWPIGIHSMTLIKKHDFRVVLILMESGAKMDEHHADGTISVQVIKGQIRLRAQKEAHTMRAGNLLMLGASIRHAVEAMEDSAFLLTIGWPSSQELQAMPHRGYGS